MCILASALPIMALLRPVPHDLVFWYGSKLASWRSLLTLVASESVEKCVVLSARASKNVTCLISFLEL